jgi:predicted dehydrogenase
MAVHGLSFLEYFTDGARPTEVFAAAGTFVHDYAVEDTSVLILRYDNDVLAQTEDSWSVPGGFDSRYEVFGTRGHAFADLLYGHPLRSVIGGSPEGGANAVSFHAITDHVVKDGHLAMFEHFASCIADGEACRSSGADGLRIMEIVEAVYRSVKSGRSEPIHIS